MLAAMLLATLGVESQMGRNTVASLPDLVLPQISILPQPPADLAAQAGNIILARPLFTPTRRPVPQDPADVAPLAEADRITGIVQNKDDILAVMQPKDGGKPVALHIGDQFQGQNIIAIDAAGLSLADGRKIRPQFTSGAATP